MSGNELILFDHISNSFKFDIQRVKNGDALINYLWDFDLQEPVELNSVEKAGVLSTQHQLLIVYLCSRFEYLLRIVHEIACYKKWDIHEVKNGEYREWENIRFFCEKIRRKEGSLIDYMHYLEKKLNVRFVDSWNREEIEQQINEIFQYRHLFMHNNSVIDIKYQERLNENEKLIGMSYPINEDYIKESITVIENTGLRILTKLENKYDR